MLDITSIKIKKVDIKKLRAFVDIKFNDCLEVKGFKVIKMDNGKRFVAKPSQKSNDGEYYPTVWVSKELDKEIQKEVLKEYDIQNEPQEDYDDEEEDIPFL